MNHVFTLVTDDGETKLEADPGRVESRLLEHGPTQVELTWDVKRFKRQDKEGYAAAVSVWPGTAELVVARAEADEPQDPEQPEEPQEPQEPGEEPVPLPEPQDPVEGGEEEQPLPEAAGDAELFRGVVTGVVYDKCQGVVTVVAVSDDEDEEPQEPGDEVEELVVTATAGAELSTLDVVVDNGGHGAVTIDFGDGSEPVTNAGDNTEVSTHTYSGPGTYVVVVTDADEAERSEQVEVIVEADGSIDDGSEEDGDEGEPTEPTEPTEPGEGEDDSVITVNATISANDPSGLTVDFTVDNHGHGPVTIDFGDGQTAANAGDGIEVASHTYAAAGSYEATVTDDDEAERIGEFTVELTGAVEEPGPDAPAPVQR
ncbi:PKD domain-containing protein [Streptomyces cellulosae]|uniref:PKD domain-containing protein n=1 Tax=Streptomyces cellulosae TaxID=1968 RepID=A0ABW6JG52_STRCE